MRTHLAGSLALLLALVPVARADEHTDSHAPGFTTPTTPPKTGPVVTGPAKPNPKAGTPKPIALPKALPRDNDQIIHTATETVPPFLGMFGPAELLEHTGFTSKPGQWIRYDIVSKRDPSVRISDLRIAHVAPEVPQGAWLEIEGEGDETGLVISRILTKGRGNGNVYRLLAKVGVMAPLDVPLTSLSLAEEDIGAMYAEPSTLTLQGEETVTVPLGTFLCDRWLVKFGTRELRHWIARDKSLPFNRAVKMEMVEGVAVAVALGKDAVAKIPARAQVQ